MEGSGSGSPGLGPPPDQAPCGPEEEAGSHEAHYEAGGTPAGSVQENHDDPPEQPAHEPGQAPPGQGRDAGPAPKDRNEEPCHEGRQGSQKGIKIVLFDAREGQLEWNQRHVKGEAAQRGPPRPGQGTVAMHSISARAPSASPVAPKALRAGLGPGKKVT